MATAVERTLHEEGLDLMLWISAQEASLSCCGQCLNSHPIQMSPQKTLAWLLGRLCIQGTSKLQHNLCCSGQICRVALSFPNLKKIQGCLPSLQSHTWAHCTACCKSPKYHCAKTGVTPLPTSPDLISAWAVLTFPWAGAWSAAPQGFHVADIP